MPPIEVKTYLQPSISDPMGNKTIISAILDDSSVARVYAGEEILSEITKAIAAKYVEENYAKIAEHINPIAIANLTIAECANKVAGMVKPEEKTR